MYGTVMAFVKKKTIVSDVQGAVVHCFSIGKNVTGDVTISTTPAWMVHLMARIGAIFNLFTACDKYF